tara:strand:- start:168 stop:785 length:618 start_codon:yes stop_codon:yes gene_type:complete
MNRKIPKIMHHVWLGPNALPKPEQSYIDSWKEHHKDYDFMIWHDKDIKSLNLNENCLEAMKKAEPFYACQADIIRYIVIQKFGGIYIDTDVQCYRNIDDLLTEKLEFIGLRPHRGNWMTNAFFGSEENSEMLKIVIKNITGVQHRVRNPYGPTYLTKNVRRYFNFMQGEVDHVKKDNVKILPCSFWGHKNKDAYCKHYFKASWRK